ncbi:MAG: pyridoxamine 5'-phosphate oxidase family protein [Methanobacteriota archaeon]
MRVVDEHTIAWPNYDGNGMYLSMGDLAKNPHVGLLFIDFQDPSRLRVNGEASIATEDPLLSEWPEAQFVVRVRVREVFPNCPRYIHRMQLVERGAFVPREGCETPIPDWKKAPWANDRLAEHDPARRASAVEE